MAENGFCADGDQEQWIRDGVTEIDGKLPVNTDGGCPPAASRSAPRVFGRSTTSVSQLRGQAGTRQVPNAPKTGYTHVYGAPGPSGCTIITR